MNTHTEPVSSIDPAKISCKQSQWQRGLLFTVVLLCLASSPQTRATCRDGCDVSNTYLGDEALAVNTSALDTAIGYSTLQNNTSGQANTAVGSTALQKNTTGSNNTACGVNALAFNTTASGNTATGVNALDRKSVV